MAWDNLSEISCSYCQPALGTCSLPWSLPNAITRVKPRGLNWDIVRATMTRGIRSWQLILFSRWNNSIIVPHRKWSVVYPCQIWAKRRAFIFATLHRSESFTMRLPNVEWVYLLWISDIDRHQGEECEILSDWAGWTERWRQDIRILEDKTNNLGGRKVAVWLCRLYMWGCR